MPVGQPRQALESGVAEHLPLPAQHRAGGRAGHLTQLRVHLRQQPNVHPRVAALKRSYRRRAAPILYASRLPMLADQARQLRPRAPGHLPQIALHQPLVRLAQAVIAQLHQRAAHQSVGALAVAFGKIHRLAALDKGANLLQRPNPLRL